LRKRARTHSEDKRRVIIILPICAYRSGFAEGNCIKVYVHLLCGLLVRKAGG
jgi:hypothetical protein